MANPTPRAPTKTPEKAVEALPDAPAAAPAGTLPATYAPLYGGVSLPSELAEELAVAARDDAAKERPAVSRISLRGGIMSYGGAAIPGNKLDVVVLAGAYWNKWYHRRFNPNVIVNPTCFAVTADYEESKDMEPHENVENPVNERCNTCPKAQWGSAGTPEEPSRGKACKETRRLAVIPASALESAEAISKAELAIVDVPVMSVKNYGNFVNTLAAAVQRPMWSVVTTLAPVPDAKSQFVLTFSPIGRIDEPEKIAAIKGRMEMAIRAVTTPYDEAYLQGESADKGTGQGAPVNTAKFQG